MKKICLGMLCVGMFLCSACTDFLKEEPKSSLIAATFFSSNAQAQAAVNRLYRIGAYSSVSTGVYAGNRLMQGGWHAGLFDNLDYKGQEMYIQWAQLLNMTATNVDSRMCDMFENPYTAIGSCNEIIATLEKMTEEELLSTGIKANVKVYLAEAEFFRALNYLFLVRHFGDVPMVITPVVATDDLHVPKTAVKTIYDQVIIPGFRSAIASLPAKNQYDNSMRISAPIASAFLIDALIQMAGFPLNETSKWAEAATEAKKFLSGGAYADIFALEVNEDFGELSAYNKFRSVNVSAASPGGRKLSRCNEFIYVMEYTSGISGAGFGANAWPVQVGALGTSECRVTLTNNAYRPMPRYLNMYDDAKDLRKKDRQFFADYFDKKDGSILPNPLNNTPTPYFFYDWGAVKGENSNSGRHFALFRLAEIYLLAAEAIAKSEGKTAQAVDALASIRARAYEYGGVTKAQIVTELNALSVDEFVEQVWLESYRELVFEFKQWNMIQRTRKYPKTNAMDSSIPLGTAQFVDVTTVGTGFSGAKLFTVNDLLWPFPLTQMQRNPNLTQNPGYLLTLE